MRAGMNFIGKLLRLASDIMPPFLLHIGCTSQSYGCLSTVRDAVSCQRSFKLMTQSTTKPPHALQEPTPTTLHGQTLEDNYRWMRNKSSPELIAYLEAENAYTLSVMAPTEQLQAKLYAEMLSHIKETDVSVPYRDRGWFYYVRTVEGSQYPIHCRRLAAGADSRFEESQPE